ncbi:AMP deaminase-like isoform X2 [Schistocerca gregaria]|uniref:AMP deaminase-like isoform X2 n=1 Tax=Schistocerca gregaria TaxID=7010 RepID=UPI00211EE380|nr:AMP deaminase-like isoform X2 [Schistocerca gregaria]
MTRYVGLDGDPLGRLSGDAALDSSQFEWSELDQDDGAYAPFQRLNVQDRELLALEKSHPGHQEQFHRIFISDEDKLNDTEEIRQVCMSYVEMINLRLKYVFPHPLLNAGESEVREKDVKSWVKSRWTDSLNWGDQDGSARYEASWRDGIMMVYRNKESREEGRDPLYSPPVTNLGEYYRDLNTLASKCVDGPCKTHSYTRLLMLEGKYRMHKILNQDNERLQQRQSLRCDFYNVYKVDTHVHLSSSMNQKHLLKFMKKKLREEKDVTVMCRDNKLLSLCQVFERLNLKAEDLSVDMLDVHSDTKTFNRFDKFNLKYNPIGESCLRELFLKTDNYINGRYLAELIQELITNMEQTKYQCAEWRLSVYGRSPKEWSLLASWVVDNNLISNQVRYLIQVPRLYEVYKVNNLIDSFQDMLSSIFEPLFAVTIDPASNPKLHLFLYYCTGIDCVDDESKVEPRMARKFPPPNQWKFRKNPPYTYYLFYLWANIYVLNNLRMMKGLPTLAFRPHSGEAGESDHLLSAFLLADGIAHGINLRRLPVLQYLFYLTQIPIAMSPLSNNSLFLDYSKNPFPKFYARGLNVSLSTDDPLQFHYTREPLIEEYSIAAQVWKLNSCEICEIARMSVLQSSFPHALKTKWIGPNYHLPGLISNDISYTNVPHIRIAYRHETLLTELKLICSSLAHLNVNLGYFESQIHQGVDFLSKSQSAAERLVKKG